MKAAPGETLDVIFVGEMRDVETIEQVLRAAESGHLVINTPHSDDALGAATRIVGAFRPDERPPVRQGLAGVLSGVAFPRLLPSSSDGRCHHQRSRGP